MSTVTQYMVEDPNGAETGPFDTYAEARAYAEKCDGRVVALEFEFSDSYLVDDFTPKAET